MIPIRRLLVKQCSNPPSDGMGAAAQLTSLRTPTVKALVSDELLLYLGGDAVL